MCLASPRMLTHRSAFVTVVAGVLLASKVCSVRFVDRDADEDRLEEQASQRERVMRARPPQAVLPNQVANTDSENLNMTGVVSAVNLNKTFKLPTNDTFQTFENISRAASRRHDCLATEYNWDLGWSVEKHKYCCENEGVGCSATIATFNCSSGLATWGQGWSTTKKDWCCEHQQVGCVDHCKNFNCDDGNCEKKICLPKCKTDTCTVDECCDCTPLTDAPTPCPTPTPTPCPTPDPTCAPVVPATPPPTPLPTEDPTPSPTPVPSPCPTPPTPAPTPTPTYPTCVSSNGCDVHSGVCHLDKFCEGNWTCGCPLGYRCVAHCEIDYENCHTPRDCRLVVPSPVPTPVPPIVIEPTTQQTTRTTTVTIPPSPIPTPDPTPRPTPRPTPIPTPTRCNETRGCADGSPYGVCYDNCDCEDDWECGCLAGYECIRNCDECHAPKVCALITPSPTPAPTPEPTPEPTPVPTPEPTEKVAPTAPPTRRPVRPPTASPTPWPTTGPPTPSPTPLPTYASCGLTHNCNASQGGECLLKSQCAGGWTCSCQRNYLCVKDCFRECTHTPRGCLVVPTPKPTPALTPPRPPIACSGWSASSGIYRGMGRYCSSWGGTAVKWCFVEEGYDGVGHEWMTPASELLTSDPIWNGKYILQCDNLGCVGFSCENPMRVKPEGRFGVCTSTPCARSECCENASAVSVFQSPTMSIQLPFARIGDGDNLGTMSVNVRKEQQQQGHVVHPKIGTR